MSIIQQVFKLVLLKKTYYFIIGQAISILGVISLLWTHHINMTLRLYDEHGT